MSAFTTNLCFVSRHLQNWIVEARSLFGALNQSKGKWIVDSYLGSGADGLTSRPKQETAEDPHCLMPIFSVFLLESTGLAQPTLPLRVSLLLYFMLSVSTYLQTLWPGRLSFNPWSLSLLSSNPILWHLPDMPRASEVQEWAFPPPR